MSNPRSASNAWAKIKNKLMSPGEDSVATPKSPAKATPKKKATSKVKSEPVVDGEDGEAGADTANPSPKKAATPRKRAQKKQDVDGETSPKKKGRPAKGKKATENESAAGKFKYFYSRFVQPCVTPFCIYGGLVNSSRKPLDDLSLTKR